MKCIRLLLTSLVLIVAIAASCGGAPPTPTLTLEDAIATVEASVKATATALAQPLPTRTPTPRSTRTPTPASHQQILSRVQYATVYVEVADDRGRIVGAGSGSIVQEDGLILTNWHVISDRSGKTFNSDGLAFIGITREPTRPPALDYRAVLVAYDRYLDLALLRIVADGDGRPVSQSQLRLPAIPLGDSNTLQLGETIFILGYPGAGGSTVTLTRGVLAGFEQIEGYPGDWIKTDTEISEGSSGGVAVDERGYLVGIPTAISVARLGKIGYLRPINLAKPLIGAAQGKSVPPSVGSGQSVPSEQAPSPPPDVRPTAIITPTHRAAPPPTSTPRPPSPPAPSYVQVEVTVPAKPVWYSTGIRVTSGDIVSIAYVRGQWSAWTNPGDAWRWVGANGYAENLVPPNPQYQVPTAPAMSLIARIGNEPAFHIGSHKQFSASSSGILYLGANDNMYGDNSGNLVVRIIVNRR